MQIISEKVVKGKRRVMVELAEKEHLISVYDSAQYKLGYPLEDIVSAEEIRHASQVMWCSIEQRGV